MAGLHACVDDPRLRALAAFYTFFVGAQNRFRFRCHVGTFMQQSKSHPLRNECYLILCIHLYPRQGSDLECQYKLMTFGIPSAMLPVSSNGEVDGSSFQNWIEGRKRSDGPTTIGQEALVIVIPGPCDVLLGRGKLIQEHTGNLRYRHIVESHTEQYERCSKTEKTQLASEIVQIVKDRGGRFLKKIDEGWVEANAETVRDKVSHSFRNRRSVVNGSRKKGSNKATKGAVKPGTVSRDHQLNAKKPRSIQSSPFIFS